MDIDAKQPAIEAHNDNTTTTTTENQIYEAGADLKPAPIPETMTNPYANQPEQNDVNMSNSAIIAKPIRSESNNNMSRSRSRSNSHRSSRSRSTKSSRKSRREEGMVSSSSRSRSPYVNTNINEKTKTDLAPLPPLAHEQLYAEQHRYEEHDSLKRNNNNIRDRDKRSRSRSRNRSYNDDYYNSGSSSGHRAQYSHGYQNYGMPRTPPLASKSAHHSSSSYSNNGSSGDYYYNNSSSYKSNGNGSANEDDERERYAGEYTSICLKNLNSKMPEEELKDLIYSEFKRYGKFSVKVTMNRAGSSSTNERIAFVNFDTHSDAKAAKRSKQDLKFCGYSLYIEPVFKHSSSTSIGSSSHPVSSSSSSSSHHHHTSSSSTSIGPSSSSYSSSAYHQSQHRSSNYYPPASPPHSHSQYHHSSDYYRSVSPSTRSRHHYEPHAPSSSSSSRRYSPPPISHSHYQHQHHNHHHQAMPQYSHSYYLIQRQHSRSPPQRRSKSRSPHKLIPPQPVYHSNSSSSKYYDGLKKRSKSRDRQYTRSNSRTSSSKQLTSRARSRTRSRSPIAYKYQSGSLAPPPPPPPQSRSQMDYYREPQVSRRRSTSGDRYNNRRRTPSPMNKSSASGGLKKSRIHTPSPPPHHTRRSLSPPNKRSIDNRDYDLRQPSKSGYMSSSSGGGGARSVRSPPPSKSGYKMDDVVRPKRRSISSDRKKSLDRVRSSSIERSKRRRTPPPPPPANDSYYSKSRYDEATTSSRSRSHRRSRSASPTSHSLSSGGVSHYFDNDDRDATRTLFVGNLDNDVENEHLKRLFDRYGIIEEIDIKRNQSVQPAYSGGGSSSSSNSYDKKTYAFIRYENMDMAIEAKYNMNGKKLNGKNACKIGYGKVQPTNCLWVGGLSDKISKRDLEREFKYFTNINSQSSYQSEMKIDWKTGSTHALILYSNSKQAEEARHHLRGRLLYSNTQKLRIDFADPYHFTQNNGNSYDRSYKDKYESERSRSPRDSNNKNKRNGSPSQLSPHSASKRAYNQVRSSSISPKPSSSSSRRVIASPTRNTGSLNEDTYSNSINKLDYDYDSDSKSKKSKLSSLSVSSSKSLGPIENFIITTTDNSRRVDTASNFVLNAPTSTNQMDISSTTNQSSPPFDSSSTKSTTTTNRTVVKSQSPVRAELNEEAQVPATNGSNKTNDDNAKTEANDVTSSTKTELEHNNPSKAENVPKEETQENKRLVEIVNQDTSSAVSTTFNSQEDKTRIVVEAETKRNETSKPEPSLLKKHKHHKHYSNQSHSSISPNASSNNLNDERDEGEIIDDEYNINTSSSSFKQSALNKSSEVSSTKTKSQLINDMLVNRGLGDKLKTMSTVSDLRASDQAWSGSFTLKKHSFPSKFYLLAGSKLFAQQALPSSNNSSLHINQRLRLDSSKLDDIEKKICDVNYNISSKENTNVADLAQFSVFISLPLDLPIEHPYQQRSLHNLISYLDQKCAAGVIPLPNDDKPIATVHAFTPNSSFSIKLLKQLLPNLKRNDDSSNLNLDMSANNDFLVVVLLKSNNSS